MPASVTDSRSTPHVLTDNLFVEKCTGMTELEVRRAVETWLSVEDDPEVLEEDTELELEAVEKDLAQVDIDDDVVSSEEDQSRASHRHLRRPRSALVLKKIAPSSTRTEGMGNTAKRSTFFRKRSTHSLMKLKSNVERSRGRFRELFVTCGGSRDVWGAVLHSESLVSCCGCSVGVPMCLQFTPVALAAARFTIQGVDGVKPRWAGVCYAGIRTRQKACKYYMEVFPRFFPPPQVTRWPTDDGLKTVGFSGKRRVV